MSEPLTPLTEPPDEPEGDDQEAAVGVEKPPIEEDDTEALLEGVGWPDGYQELFTGNVVIAETVYAP